MASNIEEKENMEREAFTYQHSKTHATSCQYTLNTFVVVFTRVYSLASIFQIGTCCDAVIGGFCHHESMTCGLLLSGGGLHCRATIKMSGFERWKGVAVAFSVCFQHVHTEHRDEIEGQCTFLNGGINQVH